MPNLSVTHFAGGVLGALIGGGSDGDGPGGGGGGSPAFKMNDVKR